MLGTFLDRAKGLLSGDFLIAYWFPVFVASFISILIRAYVYGFEAALNWWQQDWMLRGQEGGFYAQLLFIIGTLIAITVLAYLLQPFTLLMIRFYEGYWPLSLHTLLTDFPELGEKKIWQKKKDQLDEAEKAEDWQKRDWLMHQLFYSYPSKAELIMSTRLGNTLRAAEYYSTTVYGMDSNFWWPRLWFLLPDRVREEIDKSLTPIVALLNFSSLIVFVAVFGSAYLWQVGFGWQRWLVLLVGIILAFISYRAAVAQTENYGENIRAAIDLYRFELLKALRQPLPKNRDEEIERWEILLYWLYFHNRSAATKITYIHDENISKDKRNFRRR
ncbi:MAG: hypothetical protein AAGU10_13950 [Methanosarcina mazei]|uniref:Uncharacterized protein n=1 Tax=Methanosarcina mazei LYC TaxID=1434114 RepID=A0A0E3RPL3_METMZ|nr:hypothetical protein [Methanosarcina mazei]AKB69249.1 hypothetical protein MSMAL_2706 [Methanosarcina mazei LYC]